MGKWKLLFDLQRGRYGGEAFLGGNLDKIGTKNHFQSSDIFVNEILLIWAEVNYNNNKIFVPYSIIKHSVCVIIFR